MSTPRPIARRTLALVGAATGVGLTVAYALTFALYAVARSSWTVWRITPPDVGIGATLVANAASILVASLASAALLGVIVAPISMITVLVMAWLLGRLNPQHGAERTILIGITTTLCVVVLGHWGLGAALGRSLFSLGAATYLFWVGLPGLLYVCGGTMLAWWLNQYQMSTPQPTAQRPTADRLTTQRA